MYEVRDWRNLAELPRWHCVKEDMEFGLSREDAQDRDHWRLKIKGKLANPGHVSCMFMLHQRESPFHLFVNNS